MLPVLNRAILIISKCLKNQWRHLYHNPRPVCLSVWNLVTLFNLVQFCKFSGFFWIFPAFPVCPVCPIFPILPFITKRANVPPKAAFTRLDIESHLTRLKMLLVYDRDFVFKYIFKFQKFNIAKRFSSSR